MTLLARDLMEPNVLTIPATMRFREIQRLLVETNCSGAPVVDDRGAVLGVISAMDLLRAADQAYDDDIDPEEGDEPDLGGLTAIQLATPEAVWVLPDTTADQIARVMRDQGIHRVLVGSDGKLLGVVSTLDVLRAVAHR
jgi:CBS domain-containing protein